jgi:ADP-ribose pyrophosphatase YjhB (NUDIX family)
MLYFYCCAEVSLPSVRREGVRSPDGVLLWTHLDAAQAACGEVLLVVHAGRLPGAPDVLPDALHVRVSQVPPEAILNLDPFLAPRPVLAGGGYVVRRGAAGPDVLLIFRRGAWDLPKGKLDAGETVEACALREVREEVGLRTLFLRRGLGSTVHGYPEKGRFSVKTTHWFLMESPDDDLHPETDEDIEIARWVPWDEARRCVGYATLRAHMEKVERLLQEDGWFTR